MCYTYSYDIGEKTNCVLRSIRAPGVSFCVTRQTSVTVRGLDNARDGAFSRAGRCILINAGAAQCNLSLSRATHRRPHSLPPARPLSPPLLLRTSFDSIRFDSPGITPEWTAYSPQSTVFRIYRHGSITFLLRVLTDSLPERETLTCRGALARRLYHTSRRSRRSVSVASCPCVARDSFHPLFPPSPLPPSWVFQLSRSPGTLWLRQNPTQPSSSSETYDRCRLRCKCRAKITSASNERSKVKVFRVTLLSINLSATYAFRNCLPKPLRAR